MKVYTYTKTYRKKDGTISTYINRVVKYGPNERNLEIPEEVKKEVIYKWKLGVPKTRIRREHNLSRNKLDEILLSFNSINSS